MSSPSRPLVLAGALALAACATETGDPAPEGTAALVDGNECTPAAFDAAAATALERDVAARLTGFEEITPGVRLADRATPETRSAAREYLAGVFTRLGYAPSFHAYGTGSNVVAELPSTTGGAETIVVGAHYDSVSRSPGANDNATGVATVLAVAQSISALSCRSRSVVFVLFDQEERGLIGSRAFAQRLVADGTSVAAVHTIDQMGWDKNGDRLIELERPDTGLADLYRAAADELGVTIPIRITTTGSTDHVSFRPAFRAIGITEGYRSGDTTPDYHRPTDTFDKVNFDYLLSTTALFARVVANQAR